MKRTTVNDVLVAESAAEIFSQLTSAQTQDFLKLSALHEHYAGETFWIRASKIEEVRERDDAELEPAFDEVVRRAA
jgi:hypothetical protein